MLEASDDSLATNYLRRSLEKVDHSDTKDLRDGFIVSLIGMALVLLLMVTVWLLSNRRRNGGCCFCCFCCCGRRTSSTHSVPQIPRISRRRSSAKEKTGLAALTVKERHAVLVHLFAGNEYHKGSSHPSQQDVESPPIHPTTEATANEEGKQDASTESETKQTPCVTQQTIAADQSPVDKETSIEVPSGVEENDNGVEEDVDYVSDDDDATCAICLNDYTEGEMVLNGRSCRHRFHRDCVIEWLDKHDHCPFCRKEMMNPGEFRDAAIETLGKERITQLGIDNNDVENNGGTPGAGSPNTSNHSHSTNNSRAYYHY